MRFFAPWSLSKINWALVLGWGTVALFAAAAPKAWAFDDVPTVTYLPAQKLVEGDEPLASSYVLSVTSPSSVPIGTTLSITPVVSVLSLPAGGSVAQALGFVLLSPSTLSFTGPGQVQTVTVACAVPLGSVAGNYAYKIATPGWPPGTLDGFATIDMSVTVAIVPQPPSVLINAPTDGQVLTLAVPGPALSVPLQFQATAPASSPILSVNATISGKPVTITATGLGTGNVAASGTMSVSSPGVYTVQASANNLNGTSSSTVEITVNVSAAAPTVAISSPAANATFSYTTGGPALSVPFAFTATSAFGGIQNLTATLNGTPVAVTTGGIGTLNATGSGSLQITAGGQYVLAVTATDPNGTATASRTFTVTVVSPVPAPVVTISDPDDGNVYTHVAGNGPLCIPFYFTAMAEGSGDTISAMSASLNGVAVNVTACGIGRSTATGSGALQVSAAGTYTFAAMAVSGGTSGSSQVKFTVKEVQPPTCTVLWLPPISLGKVAKGNSTYPIEFQIQCSDVHDCRGDDDDDPWDNRSTLKDKSVKISVYEVYSNGSTSDPEVFRYSSNNCSSRDDTYSIDRNDTYEADFDTGRGAHRYHIDVYRFPSGNSNPVLLGTREFTTK